MLQPNLADQLLHQPDLLLLKQSMGSIGCSSPTAKLAMDMDV